MQAIVRKTLGLAASAAVALTLSAGALASDQTLYERLGGKPALEAGVGELWAITSVDTRINHYFAKTKPEVFAGLMVDFLCQAAGGPCQYKGKDMVGAHTGMKLSEAGFNALAENLALDRAVEPADGRGCSHVDASVALWVDADMVACPRGWWWRRRAVEQGTAQVLGLEDVAEPCDPPVGDEELQPGPVAQPPVSVVPEDPDDAGPDVGDLGEGHPRTEPLGQHRVGRQPAADPDVEARPVLRVDDSDEGDVVDLMGHVHAR